MNTHGLRWLWVFLRCLRLCYTVMQPILTVVSQNPDAVDRADDRADSRSNGMAAPPLEGIDYVSSNDGRLTLPKHSVSADDARAVATEFLLDHQRFGTEFDEGDKVFFTELKTRLPSNGSSKRVTGGK